jgi:hypothetical protein
MAGQAWPLVKGVRLVGAHEKEMLSLNRPVHISAQV